MHFRPTNIAGLVVVEFDRNEDERGSFRRTFCRDSFAAAGIDFHVVQTNISTNTASFTLRGMHFQREPHAEAKLVSCPRGKLFDVAVDLRPGSPTYRHWRGFNLSEADDVAVYIGPGLAHGFLTLTENTDVHYLMGSSYVPGAASGVRWDDPALQIAWPAKPEVISDRDQSFPLIEQG